jgi:hypothetical protein
MDDRERMRVERQDRVRAADHLAMAAVNAVERADGDAPRPRPGLDVWKRDDLHAGANTTTG